MLVKGSPGHFAVSQVIWLFTWDFLDNFHIIVIYILYNWKNHIRDNSWYGLSQWEEALLCNAFSHWLSPYPEWDLLMCDISLHICVIFSCMVWMNEQKLVISVNSLWPGDKVLWCHLALLGHNELMIPLILALISDGTRDMIPSNLQYKTHLGRQKNCSSLRCSWSIACRRCSNHIFILDLTPDFSGSGEDNCRTIWETFQFWDLMPLILEVWR